MYLAPDPNNKPDITVRDVQSMLNAIRICYHHSWDYLSEDGRYGKKTAGVVNAFHIWRNISSQTTTDGVILGDYSIKKIKECYKTIPFNSLVSTTESIINKPIRKNAIKDTTVGAYNVGKTLSKTWIDSYENSDKFAKFLHDTEELLTRQSDNLKRRIKKLPNKARARHLEDAIAKAQQFISKAQKAGVNDAAKITYGNLTKNDIIKYLNDCSDALLNSAITKFFKSAKNIAIKIKNALKPLYDFLNKIPGLKYLGAIEKFVRGVCAMIKGEFEFASKLFMDGLREVIESIIVDMAVVAALALGGWVALVLAIIIIILSMVIDYFFFSDNPGDSLSDKYLGVSTRNVTQDTIAPWIYKKVNGEL